MISIEVSPSQLEAALNLIKADHDDATVTFLDGSTTIGHVHTSQIDADFNYQQRTDAEGTLVFTNESKHGLYKMVSDATIGQHILSLLSTLPSPAVAVQEAQDKEIEKAQEDAKAEADETLKEGQSLDEEAAAKAKAEAEAKENPPAI